MPQFAHAWSGRAALALKVMNDAMDHLLEDGPHPGSPFVPSHRVKTSGLGLRSVAEASTSEVSVVVPTPSTAPVPSPDSIFQPKWTYTSLGPAVGRRWLHPWLCLCLFARRCYACACTRSFSWLGCGVVWFGQAVAALLAKPENKSCVDCGAPDPTWGLISKGLCAIVRTVPCSAVRAMSK